MERNEPTYNWNDCLAIFRDNLPAEQFEAWFRPIAAVSYKDDELLLDVPSPYFVEHLEECYLHLMGVTLRRVYGPSCHVTYRYRLVDKAPETSVIVKGESTGAAVRTGGANARQGAAAGQGAGAGKGTGANPFTTSAPVPFESQLNPRYTFENYCGGSSNRLARSVAETVADDPTSTTFNPLFIFGPSGVGKTHLVHAIGVRVKEHDPAARVLYINSRMFESQFTVASRNGKINEFINFYQSIDLLIIDDIQDLVDKVKTQLTFFHIFRHLHLNNKRIVLTSDCPPAQLQGMPERLLTRFKWGMTVELERPDRALRMEVLRNRALRDGLVIAPDVLEFIADNVTGSIRELEGVMVSLLAHATIMSRPIDMELAADVIGNSIKMTRREMNFEIIAQSVSAYFKIETDALYSKSRKREVSDARQMLMYMAKKHAHMAFAAIGTRLSRTHSTVMYACRNIDERLPIEKKLQGDIKAIEESLMNHPGVG